MGYFIGAAHNIYNICYIHFIFTEEQSRPLGNLQTSLLTVFEAISENRSNEDDWNWDLRIICSNLDTIYGKMGIIRMFVSSTLLFFSQKNFWNTT